jgi:excisionase family DNA binding protein
MSTLTFEQIPTFLLTLGERLGNIEQLLNSSPTQTTQVEKPMDIEEAGKFVNLERPTIYLLAQRGEIPGHKRSKKWYFYASELNEWIRNGGKSILAERVEETFLLANKKGGCK